MNHVQGDHLLPSNGLHVPTPPVSKENSTHLASDVQTEDDRFASSSEVLGSGRRMRRRSRSTRSHLPTNIDSGSSSDAIDSPFTDSNVFDPPNPQQIEQVEQLRHRLRYFFMNPIQKWQAKRKLPLKLLLQMVKIVVVSLHVLLYGGDMSRFVSHQRNVQISLREMLLLNWDPVREVMAYPPAAGPYALYSTDDFYSSVDYAVRAIANITQDSPGQFGYSTNDSSVVSPMKFCRYSFAYGQVEPSKFEYTYNATIKKVCIDLPTLGPAGSSNWDSFSLQSELSKINATVDFSTDVELWLSLQLHSVYLGAIHRGSPPECFAVHVRINYDNQQLDGQVRIQLTARSRPRTCHGQLLGSTVNAKLHNVERDVWRLAALILCVCSFFLCMRSLIKAVRLAKHTRNVFETHFMRHLSAIDCTFEFLDFWLVLITLNDLLVIAGCTLQYLVNGHDADNEFVRISILYGVGIFLVWVGLLRYVAFFRHYNVVLLTVKRALPDIARFSLCAFLLYGAFCFCGWIVLGPYHMKFRSLSRTSECLFSLLNGDDMFATFATTDTQSHTVWLFSRFYLYAFVTLFIYIILSLFISIIMDAYETVKECYVTGLPKSDIQKFISDADEQTLVKPDCIDTMNRQLHNCSPTPSVSRHHSHHLTSHRMSPRPSLLRSCWNCTCHRNNSGPPYEGL